MGLSWPPRGRPPTTPSPAERECEELREQYAQACRDLDELHGLMAELIVDRERLDWWLRRDTPSGYRSREALDQARRR
jgi:hypothetical protein